MDQSCSESDVSMSPTQILERLQVLRQLQLLQRGKLQKHRLEYNDCTETSSITEIVSHFTNSTSYNTFRSLLESSKVAHEAGTQSSSRGKVSQKYSEQELIEGVSELNLSQESEFVVNSPVSSNRRISETESNVGSSQYPNSQSKALSKKNIELDEMPILSPRQDFEALIKEQLKKDKTSVNKSPSISIEHGVSKKPFLKKGEGMSRFGIKKNSVIIQNTKALPWRRKSLRTKINHMPKKVHLSENSDKNNISNSPDKSNRAKTSNKVDTQTEKESKKNLEVPKIVPPAHKLTFKEKPKEPFPQNTHVEDRAVSRKCENMKPEEAILRKTENMSQPVNITDDPANGKHPLKVHKGRTWAAVLTKEQGDFLRQLKQSDYYKNFVSPAKSTMSDISADENLRELRQEREKAEQNMFELIENKVGNDSFNLENSFFNKFIRRNLECSGESTPLIMKQCLASNPGLMRICEGQFPHSIDTKSYNTHSDAETCNSEYTDCSDDDCSSGSCCCSCKTVEETLPRKSIIKNQKDVQGGDVKRKEDVKVETKDCHDDTVTEDDKVKMAEMNAKLMATSEMLKERLRELEDEVETFRKENANLAKMREEIDLERQKFYEEKSAFEQKFNEEKILSEYYLAEEKEKLTKQKQQYERFVREMRGRLNKKEKDEVVNLKKEISDLKEEIRIKDAKSTSTIARLRNHIKIIEKEKENLQTEVEKLKKENRRIQHSNEVTRRLTNLKYLEQINKKLNNMSNKTQSETKIDEDTKYKAFEIERQSRSRKIEPASKGTNRPRAKSVPNLKVTSRYAKYFSQRSAVSQLESNDNMSNLHIGTYSDSESDSFRTKTGLEDDVESLENVENNDHSSNDEENNIERLYMEKFQSVPSKDTSNRSSLTNSENVSFKENPDPFFIRKSLSKESISPNHLSPHHLASRSKSPVSILSSRSNNKSPATSARSNYSRESKLSRLKAQHSSQSSASREPDTIISQRQNRDDLLSVSPEPSTSKTSFTKTSLTPTEFKKSDGSTELRFPNGNVKYLSADGKYSKFVYYNGDVKENFLNEGRIKYYYADAKTYHTTHADGLEVLEFPDGQVEKRYKDGSLEIRLPNGSTRYFDPKNKHLKEEWRFPDGTIMTIAADGEQRIVFTNGQVEVHAKDHKRREFPDGTVKLVYNDGTSETRYASGRVRIKDKHGKLIMDSAPG